MKRAVLFMTCVLSSLMMLAQEEANDYLPFVEKGKKWRVITMETQEQQQGKLPFIQWPPLDDTDATTEHYCHFETYGMYEEEMRNGKSYTHTFRLDDKVTISLEAGLYREENRRVYVYDEKAGRDLLMYDFSLKEGDTFTYEYGFDQPVKCKVLKLGWLDDGPEIVSSTALTSAGTMETKHRRLRTWTIGCDNGSGQYEEFATWVECVGVLENMFSMFDHDKGTSYLAYVERNSPDNWENEFLPFSICNIYDEFGQVHGCNLPTGEENNENNERRHHHLTYELDGDRLHVYGDAYTQCGPNNYAYFYEKPTDDPLVHKIEFVIQEVEPLMDCMALHATDFYVPGFDPNMNYIVVDNYGEEHPVISMTSDDYIPFVELGKKWTVIHSNADSSRHLDQYQLTRDDVIKEGKTYMQLFWYEGSYAESWDVRHLREENRKVYLFDPNLKKEFLLFDYSLKAGDTYETYSYDEQKMVTYEVLSVGYSTVGHEIFRYSYDEKADTVTTNRRFLREWTVCRTDDRSCQKTWIEGAGSLEGPLANLDDSRSISSRYYLAYVECNLNEYFYIPFSFHDDFSHLYGCNLPSTVAQWNSESVRQLNYELEGDRLHVYGTLNTPGPVSYAIFAEEPTDDPLIHKLNFSTQQVMMGIDNDLNRSLFIETDFYLTGLDPNLNYIVKDQWGEHPVINKTQQVAYRPFVEDGKVWKVGIGSNNPVQEVDYYYFDGDTIMNGKTCKRMMHQRYVTPDHLVFQINEGAWYEEDKKVYQYSRIGDYYKLMLMYDFSLDDNDIVPGDFYNGHYVIGPKQTGGIKGFKGVYRDITCLSELFSTWLEGVGSLDGPILDFNYYIIAKEPEFLMSCTVGDEVIYLNDAYEDGATPEGARKDRIDFTHTIKIRPKTRMMEEAEAKSLYGEYNSQQLGLNLNALDEAYQVSITDEAGKVVYEKAVNAGSIVGLNIDISAYIKGRYTVTVENSNELFTGQFETQTTGISDAESLNDNGEMKNDIIYNLQGQRVNSLQKGLNIVNGRKVYVK